MLFVAGVGAALLALVPLGYVVGYTISIGGHQAWALIARRRVGELLFNTSTLVLGCMIFSVLVGLLAAWLVERTDLPGHRAWHVMLTMPLAIPAFVNSFGWVSLLPNLDGYWGALLVTTLSYFPLVYLPIAVMLRGLDPASEEMAYSLGLSRARTFLRVVIPQLRPALLGGALLVGIHLLAEFGALQMLRFPTFTTAIYDQYRSTFNGPAANMLASVLVLCCLALLVAELRLRGAYRYARAARGAPRAAPRHRLGRLRVPAILGVGALVALALAVPVVSLFRWLLAGASTAFPVAEIASAAGTSIGLASVAALLTTALALPVAWLAVRHRGVAATVIERSTYFSHALPGIVVALALVTVSIRWARPLYQTVLLLVIAYAIMFLSRAVVSVRAALDQAPPLLEDVAHGLGSGVLTTLRRVTLPLIAPGLGAGGSLVFLAVVTELTATLLLAPTGTATLATKFWSHSYSVEYGAAAPYGLLMVLVSAPAAYLLSRETRRFTRS
jgi:iron(III) transport system permease protein